MARRSAQQRLEQPHFRGSYGNNLVAPRNGLGRNGPLQQNQGLKNRPAIIGIATGIQKRRTEVNPQRKLGYVAAQLTQLSLHQLQHFIQAGGDGGAGDGCLLVGQIDQLGFRKPAILARQPGENPAVITILGSALLLIVPPQVTGHFPDPPFPVRHDLWLAPIQRLGGGVAIKLLHIVSQAGIAEVIHGQLGIGRNPEFQAVMPHPAVQVGGEFKMSPFQDAGHRVAGPPTTVLHPFAAKVGLKWDRDRGHHVSMLAHNLLNQLARGGRNPLICIHEPKPFVGGNGNRDVACLIKVGNQRMRKNDVDQGTGELHRGIAAFHVDQDQLTHVRPEHGQAIDDIQRLVAGQHDSGNHRKTHGDPRSG